MRRGTFRSAVAGSKFALASPGTALALPPRHSRRPLPQASRRSAEPTPRRRRAARIVVTGFRALARRGAQRQARVGQRRSTRSSPRTSPSSPTRTSPNRCSASPASRSSATPARAARSPCAASARSSPASASTAGDDRDLAPTAPAPTATAPSTSTSSPRSCSARSVVHKTAEASLDEGSLGAVVDLNTGNPLAGKAGLHGRRCRSQGRYNDLSQEPRTARSPACSSLEERRRHLRRFGLRRLSKTDTLELGNNTVRWAQARFDSVERHAVLLHHRDDTRAEQRLRLPSAACDQAALAFHPRIPRYGEVAHDRERLGLTGSRSSGRAERRAPRSRSTALYSSFKEDREEKWGEVLLRSQRALDRRGQLRSTTATTTWSSATLNDAWVRTEHYLRKSRDRILPDRRDLGPGRRPTSSASPCWAASRKSDADIPVETTIVFDDRDAQGYQLRLYRHGDARC